MADIIKKFENELAFQKMGKGEGTGPISRILSNVNILIIVFLLATLVKNELYVPALILVLLGFTRFGHFVIIGLGIYFLVIGYWTGVIIFLIAGLVGYSSVYFGTKNIKKNLYSAKARIDPFEGMADLVPILILQSIFFFVALITSGIASIIFWILFGLITLFEVGRFYHRLASPWRNLHYPIMVRYAAIAGAEAAMAQNENRDFDVKKALHNLAKNIFPDFSDEEIQEGISVVEEKMQKFSDRESLEHEFTKANSSIDKDKLKEVLDKIAHTLRDPKERGLIVRWFVAEMIERDYGKAERAKYLRSVISGQAD